MKLWKLPWLLAYYAVDLVRANLVLAGEVLRPGHRLVAGIVGVDVQVSGWRLLLLTNLVTLTPGTISLDTSPDGSRLYVHVLDRRTPDHGRASVHELQGRIVEVFGR